MKQRKPRSAALVVSSAIVTLLMAAIVLSRLPAPDEETSWISNHLPAAEIRQVRHLATQISRLSGRQGQDTEKSELRDAVRRLSIREAAALGLLLLRTENEMDIASWIRLATEREQRATVQLKRLLTRFIAPDKSYPIVTTIRGTTRLRSICGDEMLSEVTAVKFQNFDDSGFPIPSNLVDDDLQLLLDLPGIERIWIESASITDQGVARLASLRRLREIHLIHCSQLTDQSLKLLESPRLRSLNLTGNSQVSDAGIRSIKRCYNLTELGLEGTRISSASLPFIANCRQLTRLDIGHTKVCKRLDELRSLRHLEHLGASGLGSDDHPEPWKSLHFLSVCRRLTSIDLEGTVLHQLELRDLPVLNHLTLGHSRLKEIAVCNLPQLKRLDLPASSQSGDSFELKKVEIQGLSNLRILTVCGMNESASNELARGLRDSKNLMSLKLVRSVFTDRLADVIGQLHQLDSLDISDSPMTTRQRESILKAERLRKLKCPGDRLGLEDWQALGRSHLTDLTLSNLRLGDHRLSLPLPSLQVLKLVDCSIGRLNLKELPVLAEIDIRLGRTEDLTIAECPHLRCCTFMKTEVNNLRVDSCAHMKNVTGLFESKFGAITLIDLPQLDRIVVQERSSVHELNLRGLPRMTSASFWLGEVSSSVLESLVDMPSLKSLDVSSTKLGDDAAVVISNMTGLEKLSASPHFTRHGIERLHNLPHLNELNLYHRKDADWLQEEVPRLLPNVRNYCVFAYGLSH